MLSLASDTVLQISQLPLHPTIILFVIQKVFGGCWGFFFQLFSFYQTLKVEKRGGRRKREWENTGCITVRYHHTKLWLNKTGPNQQSPPPCLQIVPMCCVQFSSWHCVLWLNIITLVLPVKRKLLQKSYGLYRFAILFFFFLTCNAVCDKHHQLHLSIFIFLFLTRISM